MWHGADMQGASKGAAVVFVRFPPKEKRALVKHTKRLGVSMQEWAAAVMLAAMAPANDPTP